MSTSSNATASAPVDPLAIIAAEIPPLDDTFGAVLLATFFGLVYVFQRCLTTLEIV